MNLLRLVDHNNVNLMRMIAHCTFVYPCRMLMVTSSGDGALNKEQRLTKACVTLLVCFHFLLLCMELRTFVSCDYYYDANKIVCDNDNYNVD